ncbi:MAG: hypothetical protein CML06_18605 [Pseudomonadales bacterium]|nr:hypothetical protein [Pseudomonadales bacterium]
MQSGRQAVDVLVVGGGISGAAVAAECASRGLSTLLCERDDVGGVSSSHSDQIIPGALHFLRHHNLPYFNKVSKEKALLRQRAPHLCRELNLVDVPEPGGGRSPASRLWMWLFHHWLAGAEPAGVLQRCPTSEQLQPLRRPEAGPLLLREWLVDTARLVIENLVWARESGARILPHTEVLGARRQQGLWEVTLGTGPSQRTQCARCVVNAGGAQVNQVLLSFPEVRSRCRIGLKRKHFVLLAKWYPGDQGYVFQTVGAPLRVTPLPDHYCMVSQVCEPSSAEHGSSARDLGTRTLLETLSGFFARSFSSADVISDYLLQQPFYCDDGDPVSDQLEDYALDLDCGDGRSPLVSVFGGSFATHHAMAREVVELLAPYLHPLPAGAPEITPLPGGRLHSLSPEGFILDLAARYPWLPSGLLRRYCCTYGARARDLLEGCDCLADLGPELTPGLYQREAEFLVQTEWVRDSRDLLWRRTRLGLCTTAAQRQQLDTWIQGYLTSSTALQDYIMTNSKQGNRSLH